MQKLKVLFLCTGNSCRRQMAEGWARHLKSGQIEAHSDGIKKHGLNPHAIRVMAEEEVDISKQFSKTVSELGPIEFDYQRGRYLVFVLRSAASERRRPGPRF